MRIFLKRACAALCAVLVLAALAACGGPFDLPFLDPYEQPFVLQDGFVRYANVGYVEEFYGQGDQIFVIRSGEEMEDFCAGFPQGALAQDYDELPSLAESIADLDDAYFAENVLLVAYFPHESGSCRLRVEDLSAGEGDTLVLAVRRAFPGGIATDDEVGRAALVGISRGFYGGREVLLTVSASA